MLKCKSWTAVLILLTLESWDSNNDQTLNRWVNADIELMWTLTRTQHYERSSYDGLFFGTDSRVPLKSLLPLPF